jgi:ketosteroid isomerase-like protein
MSEENVDVVRSIYGISLGRRDVDFLDPEEVVPDFWARLAPDFELHERAELPDARVYRGREEAKEFFRKTQDVFVEARWEPQEFIDLGHAVVVKTKVVAVGRGSDVPTEMDETDVFWFRDGMIVRLEGFATKEEALEAAGLSGLSE